MGIRCDLGGHVSSPRCRSRGGRLGSGRSPADLDEETRRFANLPRASSIHSGPGRQPRPTRRNPPSPAAHHAFGHRRRQHNQGLVTVTARARGMKAAYTFNPEQDVVLNSLHVGAEFAIRHSQVAPGKRTNGPAHSRPNSARPGCSTGAVRVLDLGLPTGESLEFRFPQPTTILIQDNRQWGPSFVVRILRSSSRERPFRKGAQDQSRLHTLGARWRRRRTRCAGQDCGREGVDSAAAATGNRGRFGTGLLPVASAGRSCRKTRLAAVDAGRNIRVSRINPAATAILRRELLLLGTLHDA